MPIALHISADEYRSIQTLIKTEKSITLYQRLLFLELLYLKLMRQQIAAVLGVSADTITDWSKLYRDKGLAGLMNLQYSKRRQSSLNKILADLREAVRQGSVTTIYGLQTYIEQKHRVKFDYSWLTRYCRRNKIFPDKG